MSLAFAFEVTKDDVVSALEAFSLRVTNPGGLSFDSTAEQLLSEIGADHIAHAALDGGVEMDDQTEAAHSAIHGCLIELGVLEF